MKLLEHLESLVKIALVAEDGVQYVSELLTKVRRDFFINSVWHTLLSHAQDAMVEYSFKTLDVASFSRFCEKTNAAASAALIVEFSRLTRFDTDKPVVVYSLPRFRMEIDVYVARFATHSLSESLQDVANFNIDHPYPEARSRLLEKLSYIDTGFDLGLSPEGYVMDEMADVIREHSIASQSTKSAILTGYKQIDSATGGMIPGDLIIIGAHSGDGKSTLTLNLCYRAYLMGKNVVYAINELQYAAVRQNLCARHTVNPVFWGGSEAVQGISLLRLRDGRLTPKEQKVLKLAVDDLKQHKASRGHIYLVQLRANADLQYLEAKLAAINAVTRVDMCAIDYLLFLKRGGSSKDDRVSLENLVRGTKQLAVNFDRGRGIPIITPWQSEREKWMSALERGYYTISDWAKTSEIENSADLIWWLMRPEDYVKKNQILSGVCKNRRGPVPEPWPMTAMFDSYFIDSIDGISVEPSSAASAPRPNMDFDTLLSEALTF